MAGNELCSSEKKPSCQFAKLWALVSLPFKCRKAICGSSAEGVCVNLGKYCQQKVFSFAICVTQAEAEHICAEQFTEPPALKQGDGLQSFLSLGGDEDTFFKCHVGSVWQNIQRGGNLIFLPWEINCWCKKPIEMPGERGILGRSHLRASWMDTDWDSNPLPLRFTFWKSASVAHALPKQYPEGGKSNTASEIKGIVRIKAQTLGRSPCLELRVS